MGITIDHGLCNGCGICVDICPEDVYVMGEEFPEPVRKNECWYCGACVMDCPKNAVEILFPPHIRPVILRGDNTKGC